jgi:hypothetical protein
MTTDEVRNLLALCEKATPGPWYHVQAFQTVPKQRTIHGPVPAQRVDFVSTTPAPVHKKIVIPMPSEDGGGVRSVDMAYIAACSPEVIRALCERVLAADEAQGGNDAG